MIRINPDNGGAAIGKVKIMKFSKPSADSTANYIASYRTAKRIVRLIK